MCLYVLLVLSYIFAYVILSCFRLTSAGKSPQRSALFREQSSFSTSFRACSMALNLCVCVCFFVFMCCRVSVCVYSYLCVCVKCTQLYLYIYIYIYMYMCIHTNKCLLICLLYVCVLCCSRSMALKLPRRASRTPEPFSASVAAISFVC